MKAFALVLGTIAVACLIGAIGFGLAALLGPSRQMDQSFVAAVFLGVATSITGRLALWLNGEDPRK